MSQEYPIFAGAFQAESDDGKDQVLLVCVPVEVRNPRVPGTEARCRDCSDEVAVADSSRSFLERHPDAVIVCVECFKARLEEGE